MRRGGFRALLAATSAVAAALLFSGAAGATGAGPVVGAAHGMKTLHATKAARPVRTTNLTYHGGTVETAPAVYVVFWGYQTYGDPSGVATYYQAFMNGVGGSSWLGSQAQYCEGVSSGTINCGSSGSHVGNPSGILKGVWFDDTVQDPIPSSPTQTDIANEAIRAAGHFGVPTSTAADNLNTQFVVATAPNHNQSGFGTQWCAYHSSVSNTAYGTLAYTNLPYIPQAGTSCGQNFVNSGATGLLDGVSIVGGHELAETMTDQFPNGGWLDSSGNETGDKCAWSTSSTDITLGSSSYAVQPLWSNVVTGCALS